MRKCNLEPVTHLLTGACLARLGFNRRTALATATMVLAAEIPDLDVLWYFDDSVDGFAHHRGFTHTLIGVPVDVAVVVGAMYLYWRWRRKRKMAAIGDRPPERWESPRWDLLFFFGCIAALSHILLDFTNNYGVRPFAPFYPRWFSWDIIFIIEPLLLGALFIGLVAPALSRLVTQEISSSRSRRRVPGGRGGAIFALVFMLALWGFRDYQHRRAIAALDSLTYRGAEPLRASAFAYEINPFQWHGVVETKDFFALVPVDSSSGEVDPQNTMRIRPKPEETPVTLAAKRSRLGRVYLDWAQYPVVEVEQDSGPPPTWRIRFVDLRFAYPERRLPALGAMVVLDQNLRVIDEFFESRRKPRD